jgi:hypothetical protein
MRTASRRAFVLGMLSLGLPAVAHAQPALSPLFGLRANLRDLRARRRRRGLGVMERLRHWNEIAVDASGLDHTPAAGLGEQLGPGRASRAMAIVHIAVFDAVNAVVGGYQSYSRIRPAPAGASLEAAIAAAAHDTLCAVFPKQTPDFDTELSEDLAAMGGRGIESGMTVGRAAAAAILARRANDGSQHDEPPVEEFQSDEPGKWRQDPISQHPLALGGHWGEVTPFVLRSGDQFRIPPPPDLESAEYQEAFDEVKALGGATDTSRTDDQTEMGIYWAYDGTPSLCAPPRLYNQIALHIAELRRTDAVDLTRLLALINVCMADTGIAVWDSKYHYNFWRPVTGIREDDGSPGTVADPTYTPLGAPASNLVGPNFTPPFPAYPSGHAGFGGTLFQTLRNFYGTDRIAFTFVSDELNGETLDNEGHQRPLAPRSFATLSEAEEENGQSRIYLGIHWAFDKTEGIAQGRRVANYVFQRAFTRLRR